MSDDGQCTRANQELGVYLLGAIEPAQRALVERHLAACHPCRAELDGLAGLPSLLHRVPVGEALRLAPARPFADSATAAPLPPVLRVTGVDQARPLALKLTWGPGPVTAT